MESQPLVYTTSPSEKETEDTLWDEEKRVPDILEDLENANTTDNTGNKLGTLIGVYCPTIQNIFGVILFIRMSWIVGVCGIYQVNCYISNAQTRTILIGLLREKVWNQSVSDHTRLPLNKICHSQKRILKDSPAWLALLICGQPESNQN